MRIKRFLGLTLYGWYILLVIIIVIIIAYLGCANHIKVKTLDGRDTINNPYNNTKIINERIELM